MLKLIRQIRLVLTHNLQIKNKQQIHEKVTIVSDYLYIFYYFIKNNEIN